MQSVNKQGEIEFLYRVDFEDGKMSGFNKTAFEKETKYLSGKYEWVLRQFKKRRTNEQNNTQWWYFTEIANKTGDTPQRIKSLLSFKFLLIEEVDENTGEVEKRVKGTSELNTEEHNVFMENVRNWAVDFLRLKLPLPSKTWQIDFENT